eukprot:355170-Chlamydomonas_euryale.AAC.2
MIKLQRFGRRSYTMAGDSEPEVQGAEQAWVCLYEKRSRLFQGSGGSGGMKVDATKQAPLCTILYHGGHFMPSPCSGPSCLPGQPKVELASLSLVVAVYPDCGLSACCQPATGGASVTVAHRSRLGVAMCTRRATRRRSVI